MLHHRKFHARLTAVPLVIITLLVFSACSTPAPSQTALVVPGYVMDAPLEVRQSYEYAVAYPEHLETVPCYCGCHRVGHKSALDCFISGKAADGTITFDAHAAACGICIEIAQDVIRLRAEGKSAVEVRQSIDATYSEIGPGTDTIYPTE
jgi:hypothetical protein